MKLEELSWLAQIVEAVLVIASLAFVWYELRQGRILAKAANAQSLAEHAATFNSLLIQDGKLAKLWYSYGKNLGEGVAEESDRLRYREMLVQWLIFHENIYYQHKKGLLDAEIYDSWLEDLRYTIRHHNLLVIGDYLKTVFPGEYGDYLLELKRTSIT